MASAPALLLVLLLLLPVHRSYGDDAPAFLRHPSGSDRRVGSSLDSYDMDIVPPEDFGDFHGDAYGGRRPAHRLNRYRYLARRMNDVFEASEAGAGGERTTDTPPGQGRRNLRAISSDYYAVDGDDGEAAKAPPKEAGNGTAPARAAAAKEDLRAVIEESFDNARDVEEIFEGLRRDRDENEPPVVQPGLTTPSEDYYADLPDFVARGEGRQCKCLDCPQDKVCGGIWKRESFPRSSLAMDLSKIKVHIVVSHCLADLDWIADWTSAHPVASVHVISKW